MEDERYSFLDTGRGGSLLVIGAVDRGLAGFLRDRFRRIRTAAWHKEQLRRSARDHGCSEDDSDLLAAGHPELPAERFDVILALWTSPFAGDADRWFEALADRIEPRGRLIIIEDIPRPMSPAQQVTMEIKGFRIAVDAARGWELTPVCDVEGLFSRFRSGDFTHVRRLVFTDPGLLIAGDAWRAIAEDALADAAGLERKIDAKLNEDLKQRAANLREQIENVPPATPSFAMLAGTKRTVIRSKPLREPDGKSVGEPRMSTVSLGIEPRRDDPYDKLLYLGPDGLRSSELMAVAMGMPHNGDRIVDHDPRLLAQRIVSEYGTKAVAVETNPGRLAEMLCVPLETACQIVAIFALGRRFFDDPPSQYPTIRGPEDAYIYLKDMGSLRKEHLRGLYLNVQNRLIHDEVLSIGTLSNSLVHPREVFAPALEYTANSIIIAHNHPSGDLTPSANDVAITKQLAQAGRIMGIELVDHLIIGEGGFVSLRKERVL
mgnify:CR=1 FL=1